MTGNRLLSTTLGQAQDLAAETAALLGSTPTTTFSASSPSSSALMAREIQILETRRRIEAMRTLEAYESIQRSSASFRGGLVPAPSSSLELLRNNRNHHRHHQGQQQRRQPRLGATAAPSSAAGLGTPSSFAAGLAGAREILGLNDIVSRAIALEAANANNNNNGIASPIIGRGLPSSSTAGSGLPSTSGAAGLAAVVPPNNGVSAGVLLNNATHHQPTTQPPPRQPNRKRRGGVTDTFPRKLHRAITEMEAQGRDDIIAWLPHGRAFAIRKPKEFAHDVMPKYFRMSSLSSFQRQINLYNFKRITEGRDKGAYYHELFLRGKGELTKSLKRIKSKGKTTATAGAAQMTNPLLAGGALLSLGGMMCPPIVGGPPASSLGGFYEPDFYNMPPLSSSTAGVGNNSGSTGGTTSGGVPSVSCHTTMGGNNNR